MSLAALAPIATPITWRQQERQAAQRKTLIRYPLVDGQREPNPAQRRFARMIQEKDYVLFSGGVGSGKTLAGAYESARLCYQNPGRAGFIVAHDWNTLLTVTLPAFLSFFPSSWVEAHNKNLRCIRLRGNRLVYYGSANNPSSLEAKNVSWAWGDEVRYWSKAAYIKWIARGRQRGGRCKFICTSTPAMNWMFNEFCTGRANRGVVFASTRENAHNLRSGYIPDLEASYSKRVFESYVEGEFKALSGEVFDEFKRRTHLVDLPIDWTVPVDVGFDPGRRKAAMVFLQHFDYCGLHDVDNCDHIVGELLNDKKTNAKKMLKDLNYRFDREGWQRGCIYIDKAGNSGSQEVGFSTVDVFEGAGWTVMWTTDVEDCWVPYGIDVINNKFGPVDGRPSLFIDSHLEGNHERGIYAAITGSEYPEDKAGRPISDEPIKEGELEHVRDALRYYMVNRYPACRSEIYGLD